MRPLLRLINCMAIFMVVLLGATAAHAEQPAHSHAISFSAQADATGHPTPTGEHADLPFHCGAAMLGFSVTDLQQAWACGSQLTPLGSPALTAHSVPLDPRPPRA